MSALWGFISSGVFSIANPAVAGVDISRLGRAAFHVEADLKRKKPQISKIKQIG
jgi:hypothetical protein